MAKILKKLDLGRMESIRIIRERMGWSYGKLAAVLGVTVTSAQNLEEKGASYKPQWLTALRKATGLSLEEFWQLIELDASKPIKKRKDAGIFRAPRR